MSGFMVDVEADGPCPGMYSMIEIGVVKIDDSLKTTFYGQLAPIADQYQESALKVTGYSREETLEFPGASETIHELYKWINLNNTNNSKPMFFSDNNGFDWQFVNYYFHYYFGENPFGFSSRNIGDLYKGMQKDMFKNFKHLRKTKHTHNPVDDAIGNAEALLAMRDMGLRIGKG